MAESLGVEFRQFAKDGGGEGDAFVGRAEENVEGEFGVGGGVVVEGFCNRGLDGLALLCFGCFWEGGPRSCWIAVIGLMERRIRSCELIALC